MVVVSLHVSASVSVGGGCVSPFGAPILFSAGKLSVYLSSIMVVQQTPEIIKSYIQILRPPSDDYKH